jgi:tRNA-modifying protein YgfZ
MPDGDGYAALRGARAAVRLDRDVVGVEGPEAAAYLQGQLSQDVAGLAADGGRAWSFLLQPTGKVDALVAVTRTGPDAFLLDVDAGWGEAVLARLTRFKLRTRAEIGPRPDVRVVTVRGPEADDRHPLPGLPGHDLVGAGVAVPPGVPVASAADWEAVRVEAGIPRMGAELTTATIPAEAGQWWIDRAVSFTKGCYTGQELVARIDSRGGHVPRRLLGLVVAEGGAAPPVGATVDDGAGTVTSVALSPARAGPVAIALVARAVDPPAEVTVSWEGGRVAARVESLPLVT